MSTYLNARLARSEAACKHLFFWRDLVVFEDWGRIGSISPGHFMANLDERFSPAERDALDAVFLSDREVAGLRSRDDHTHFHYLTGWPTAGEQENAGFAVPVSPYQHAYNEYLTFRQSKQLQGWADRHALDTWVGYPGVVDGLRRWELTRRKMDCDFEILDPLEEYALRTACRVNLHAPEQAPYDFAAMVLPDVSELGWHDLIALRADGGYVHLRRKMRELIVQSDGDAEIARKQLQVECDNARDEIFERARPQTRRVAKRAAIEQIASLTPVGPVVGFAKAAADIANEREAERRLSWFYALTTMKQRSDRSS